METEVFTFKARSNAHSNDCWCDAISLFTKQPYEKIYKMFKPMLDKTGGLEGSICDGYLMSLDYDVFTQEITLYEAMQMYDTRKGMIFILIDPEKSKNEKHMVYIEDNVIHDIVDEFEILLYFEKYKVHSIVTKNYKDFRYFKGDK